MAGLARLFRQDSLAPIGGGGGPLRRGDAGSQFQNPYSGIGGPTDRRSATWVEQRPALTRYEIDALIRQNGVARRIVAREPKDATREGFRFTDDADPALARLWNAAEGRKGMKVLRAIRRAATWAAAYGGAAIVPILDDGLPPHYPIDRSRIRKIRRLLVLDRYEIIPEAYSADPNSPWYGDPILYRVIQVRSARTMLVHASRVIRFEGVELPDRVQMTTDTDSWGGSQIDLTWEQLRDYFATAGFSAEGVSLLSQGVLKSKGLSRTLEAQDVEAVVNRLEAMRMAAGILGDIAIDETEEYQILGRPLTGIGEAGEIAKDALRAVTGMPAVILFGETPGGINSGEQAAEVRAWYDQVATEQPEKYQPPLERILDLMMAAREGPTGGAVLDYEIEWQPLWQESADEIAKRRQTNASRRQLDVASQIVSPDEARQDPDIAEIYQVDPDAPAPTLGPELEDPALVDEEDEEDPEPEIFETYKPPGARLVSVRVAAEQSGFPVSTINTMRRRQEIKQWKSTTGQVRVNLTEVLGVLGAG